MSKKELVTIKNTTHGDLIIYDNGSYKYSTYVNIQESYWKIEDNILYCRHMHDKKWLIWKDRIYRDHKVIDKIIDAISSNAIDDLLKESK